MKLSTKEILRLLIKNIKKKQNELLSRKEEFTEKSDFYSDDDSFSAF
ncbi:hypothetical protein GCM10008904_21490 [Paraclostridium ghonii]|uniref:Uncharacterized protein n=1 Tax=Paraclostridium ghonii TaxID=29358 RepID=A0ABU0N056_9FIRM|nr:hypothetical protein [Paeniclostridium ghonii]MDQ0556542.1 hypothetical protein [Paeniclostridium ghonii]